MLRAKVNPEVLRWARERSGRSREKLSKQFKSLPKWESGELAPTLKQLEAFAQATHTPIGCLFLPEPMQEELPIPDMRTVADRGIELPSADLLDVIYLCQQRQEWYRDFARKTGEPKRDFVGSARTTDSIEATASRMREALGLDLEERRRYPTWTESLRRFIDRADALGVLVMVSGVVGVNNRRTLDPQEFRGFALCDELAPLVFVNGADAKAAQMFTLAHELAHIWLGKSALSDVGPATFDLHGVEKGCNRIAAELLVPKAALKESYEPSEPLRANLARLARRFKVSALVVIRRLHDAGWITREEMREVYEQEMERIRSTPRGGGDFYLNQAARAGKRFSRALVTNTFEGQNSFTEAFRLLGVKKAETLRRFGEELGVRL